MAPAPPQSPVVLNDKYELGRQLGAGGMGSVFWARHLVLQRAVAVKLLTPELMNSRQAVERFVREARALAAVDHPAVCHIFDADTDPAGVPFLVMELLEGETLDKVLQSAPQTPLAERVRWVVGAAEGLAAAHARGIVHRDVKPSNLMLLPSGAVKVLDFGVAKSAHDHSRELTGDNTVGTVMYMSPEQLMGEDVGTKSDVWSLGVTLYKLLSGRLPFAGDTMAAYVRAVLDTKVVPLRERGVTCPDALWQAIAGVLRPVDSRTPTMERFAEELRHALPTQPSVSLVATVAPEAPRPPAARRAGPLLVAGVAAIIVVVGGAVWWTRAREQAPDAPIIRVEPIAPSAAHVPAPVPTPPQGPSAAAPAPAAPTNPAVSLDRPPAPARRVPGTQPRARPEPASPEPRALPPPEPENPDRL